MNAWKFLGGFMIGTAVGLTAGLLIAPNQIRKNLMKRSRVYSQQAIDAVRQYLENLEKGEKKTGTYTQRGNFTDPINEGIKAS